MYFFVSWSFAFINCFLVSHVCSQNFQESKHKCFKTFLGQRLVGQIHDDAVWHSSLLVRMWEAQCESLRGHSLAPCKLFQGPKRIRCSKNTIFAGSVCYVTHAQTWCLVTTLFEEVGKVGFQAVVLRLKATNNFSSIFENTKMLIKFELSSNVNLLIAPWWFHANGDITTLH